MVRSPLGSESMFVFLGPELIAVARLATSTHRDRVVCVMTTGQEWQFRPYKWTEPKELFHNGESGPRSHLRPDSGRDADEQRTYLLACTFVAQSRASTSSSRTIRQIQRLQIGTLRSSGLIQSSGTLTRVPSMTFGGS